MISVVYTEAINSANPCACSYPSKAFMSYSIDETGTHKLMCSRCDFFVEDSFFDRMLERWNSVNIDEPEVITKTDMATEPSDQVIIWRFANKTFGQAQDELLTKITDRKQLVFNAFCAMFVKKTADDLPDLMDGVLLWVDGQWRYTWLDAGGYWETDTDYIEVHDDQYWLPLPTFNPESEG